MQNKLFQILISLFQVNLWDIPPSTHMIMIKMMMMVMKMLPLYTVNVMVPNQVCELYTKNIGLNKRWIFKHYSSVYLVNIPRSQWAVLLGYFGSYGISFKLFAPLIHDPGNDKRNFLVYSISKAFICKCRLFYLISAQFNCKQRRPTSLPVNRKYQLYLYYIIFDICLYEMIYVTRSN